VDGEDNSSQNAIVQALAIFQTLAGFYIVTGDQLVGTAETYYNSDCVNFYGRGEAHVRAPVRSCVLLWRARAPVPTFLLAVCVVLCTFALLHLRLLVPTRGSIT
jgi:hypothetical protein